MANDLADKIEGIVLDIICGNTTLRAGIKKIRKLTAGWMETPQRRKGL